MIGRGYVNTFPAKKKRAAAGRRLQLVLFWITIAKASTPGDRKAEFLQHDGDMGSVARLYFDNFQPSILLNDIQALPQEMCIRDSLITAGPEIFSGTGGDEAAFSSLLGCGPAVGRCNWIKSASYRTILGFPGKKFPLPGKGGPIPALLYAGSCCGKPGFTHSNETQEPIENLN